MQLMSVYRFNHSHRATKTTCIELRRVHFECTAASNLLDCRGTVKASTTLKTRKKSSTGTSLQSKK